jgi:hypothetical protein
MRTVTAVTTALFFVLGIGAAKAADPTLLAETGAFLLGNAYRCGVQTERVSHAGKVIQDLIAVASHDANEEKAATSRFSEIFVASAYPGRDRDALIPACQVVVTQFERLEQHHQQAGLN